MSDPIKTTQILSPEAWGQITEMDKPLGSPIFQTTVGLNPIQSWSMTDQVLPDIGDVDNKILAAVGATNTILISTTTAEVLKTITVSIGANGNWYVGNADTGVAAKGTDPEKFARPNGVYKSVTPTVSGNQVTIPAGFEFSVRSSDGYAVGVTNQPITFEVAESVGFMTLDADGIARQYSANSSLAAVPDTEAVILVFTKDPRDLNEAVVALMPTVHQAWTVASAVSSYADVAGEAAKSAAADANAGAASALAAKSAEQGAATSLAQVQSSKQIVLAAQADVTARQTAISDLNAQTVAARDRTVLAESNVGTLRTQVATDRAAVAADLLSANTAMQSAQGSAADALTSSQSATFATSLAAAYANNAENVEVVTGQYSAKHWAAIAQRAAALVTSSIIFKGGWDASAGTAPPTPGAGDPSPYYRVTKGGTIAGIAYLSGDYIYWNPGNSSWYKVEGQDTVQTVNGYRGVVNLTAADVKAVAVAGGNMTGPLRNSSAAGITSAPAGARGFRLTGIAEYSSLDPVEPDDSIATAYGLRWYGNADWRIGPNTKLYSEANKPTISDVGAAPAGYGIGVTALQKTAQDQVVGGLWRDATIGLAGITLPYDGTPSQGFVGVNTTNGLTYSGRRSGATSNPILWNRLYSEIDKPTPAEIGAVSTAVLNALFPVNHLLITLNAANPSTYGYPGVWTLIENDVSILSTTTAGALGGISGSNDPAVPVPAHAHSYSGNTGTESSDHSHTWSGTTSTDGNHTHALSTLLYLSGSGGNQRVPPVAQSASTQISINAAGAHAHTVGGTTSGRNAAHTHAFSGTTADSGTSGATISVRGRSLAVFIWKRTS